MQSRDRQGAVDRPLTSRHSRGNRSLTVAALIGAVPLDPLLRRAPTVRALRARASVSVDNSARRETVIL